MSWALGVDCSSAELGVGLCNDDGPTASVSRYVANSHSEHIGACVDFLLSSNGVAPGQIERVGVATGPGSFTGLRIALAFVKGFALDRDIAVLPVSSLQSLAQAWPPPAPRLVTAFDARRGEVFWARFGREPGGLVRLSDDVLMNGEDFVGHIGDDDLVVTDTLGFARSYVFSSLAGRGNVLSVESCPCQRGLSCACMAARTPTDSDLWTNAVDVTPTYLRTSYAEERRPAKEG